MNANKVLAARERIMARLAFRDVLARSSIGQAAAARLASPYGCTGPGSGHFVRDDNPMRTGRCECCRAFVGWFVGRSEWRRVTRVEAFRYGLYAARRLPERTSS